MNIQLKEILKLSTPERILMVEAIWDSIMNESDQSVIELTTEQKNELDQRSDNIKSGKSQLSNWDEVEERIKRRSLLLR